MHPYRYLRVRPDAKGNAVFCSNSKLMIEQHWNESKKRELLQTKIPAVCSQNFQR